MKKRGRKFKWDKILTKKFLLYQYLKKSIRDIANEKGCCDWTVRFYLIKYKIKIRTKSEAAKNKPKTTKKTRQKMRDNHADVLGENNPRFKGRVKDKHDYVLVYSSDHPYKNNRNQVREHRLVVEAQIGRYLDPKWRVHHINRVRDDNRPENLMCFSSISAHNRFHKNPNNVKDNEIIFDGRKLKKEVRDEM